MKSPKILASAKGKPCTFRIPGICNRNPETTVFCHGPDKLRAKSRKSPDYWGGYGCSDCHKILDERRVEDWESYWLQGILETQKQLVEEGLLFFPISEARKPRKTVYGQTELARRRTG